MVPPVQQTPTQAQQEALHKAAVMAQENARRRAQKPTDKNLPDGVEDLVIGDGVQQYKRLREVERKLDAVMMRKRLDIQDTHLHGSKRYKSMQIWISNTVENQPWQGRNLETDMFDFNTGVESMYRVKIEGRLLNDDGLEDSAEYGSDEEDDADPTSKDRNDIDMDQDDEPPKQPTRLATTQTRTRLSHFFKAITVDFERGKNFQPDTSNQIEWKKPLVQPGTLLPHAADFDCLEFERKGDENINCIFNFYRDEERYRLSEELSDLLDTDEDDRATIIVGIWEYIKVMNLQQDEEKRQIMCDDRLRSVSSCPSPNSFLEPPSLPLRYYVIKKVPDNTNTIPSYSPPRYSKPIPYSFPTSPSSLSLTCPLSHRSSFPIPSASTQSSTPFPTPQKQSTKSSFQPHPLYPQ